MNNNIHILGFAGSLRQGSLNHGLLRAAKELLPIDTNLEIYDLSAIPLFNADIKASGEPESVNKFKRRIKVADALLIATPEYNYSIPGVLKNAIDWASYPLNRSPFNDKPLAIMGAGGRLGTLRAQLHLRDIAQHLNMHVLNNPEVMVARAWERFDQNGNLTDPETRQRIAKLLQALVDWTRRLKRPTPLEAHHSRGSYSLSAISN